MPSDFAMDLCFIRKMRPEAPMADSIEQELQRIFAGRACWHTDTKRERDLEVSVVEIKGLAEWHSEDEALRFVEARMQSDCWEWLCGFRVKVTQQEDAGASCWQKRGAV
ncbi:hypothetical protein LJK88_16455 [Paenibacillus sp. P26]|nr:hypothetical protein LJK88_16455 [Paenibacillus sp. P26]